MRILLVLLLAGGVWSELAAQRPGSAVGAHVGYSRSDLSGGDASGISSRQGAITGVYLHFPVNPRLAVRPELLFSLRGGRTLAAIAGGGSATLDIELAYLELPVLAHFTPTGGRYRPMLIAGAAPALQLGCDLQVVIEPESFQTPCNAAELTFRKMDFGVVLGGGVEAHLNRATLALEARYSSGLRSVLEDASILNRYFGILLALTF